MSDDGSAPDSPAGVLAGVRVVEFAQNAAVPQCGRLLASMGADVVKVEPPGGDAMRHLAKLTPTEGRAYATINPGKRAITLDLTHDDAPTVVDRLAEWADIALIGMKLTDLSRFGLDWEHLHQLNPRLIVLVFTAYGPEGPDADQGGYDMLVQAVSGLGFTMNRSVGGVPKPTRPAVIDFGSGAMACAGVLAALRHRDLTGEGQRVDASLLGTAFSLGTPLLGRFERDAGAMDAVRDDIDLLRQAGADFDAQRAHYESRVVAGAGAFHLYVRPYRTADGLVSIGGFSAALWAKLHDVTGVDEPPDDRDPNDPAFQAVVAAAEAVFAERTTDEWLAVLREVGYPCARFNFTYEALEGEQALANDYLVDLEHPDFGGYRTVGMPLGFSAAPSGVSGPSPRLGADTRVVLAEVGFSADEVGSLIADGVADDQASG